jgi:hypothetical protein
VLSMPEAASRGDDPVQDVEISLHRHEQYDGLQGFLSVAGKCSVDSQEIADLRRPGHRVIDLASIGFGADAVTSRAAESPGLCMLSARSGALIDTPVCGPAIRQLGDSSRMSAARPRCGASRRFRSSGGALAGLDRARSRRRQSSRSRRSGRK